MVTASWLLHSFSPAGHCWAHSTRERTISIPVHFPVHTAERLGAYTVVIGPANQELKRKHAGKSFFHLSLLVSVSHSTFLGNKPVSVRSPLTHFYRVDLVVDGWKLLLDGCVRLLSVLQYLKEEYSHYCSFRSRACYLLNDWGHARTWYLAASVRVALHYLWIVIQLQKKSNSLWDNCLAWNYQMKNKWNWDFLV